MNNRVLAASKHCFMLPFFAAVIELPIIHVNTRMVGRNTDRMLIFEYELTSFEKLWVFQLNLSGFLVFTAESSVHLKVSDERNSLLFVFRSKCH
jgi:hypothetical protein